MNFTKGNHFQSALLVFLRAGSKTIHNLAQCCTNHGHHTDNSRIRSALDKLMADGFASHNLDHQAASGPGPAYRARYAITPAGTAYLDAIAAFYIRDPHPCPPATHPSTPGLEPTPP